MKLSKVDRLTLWNQYEVLKFSNPKEAKQYKRYQKILENGYEYDYEGLSIQIDEDGMGRDDSLFVIDVLAMYDALQYATKEGKFTIAKDSAHFLTFMGFDGNNEAKFLGYTRFFREDGSFSSLDVISKDLNSHMPVIGAYQRMLAEWRKRFSGDLFLDWQKLTEADVNAILAAHIHPSKRKKTP